jgi:hypothetical protein
VTSRTTASSDLAGFQHAGCVAEQASVTGEQATGVRGAGLGGRYVRVDAGSPPGGCRHRLGQLPVPAGQGDADQLRIVALVERKQREDGQAFLLAQRRQPPASLGGVSRRLGLQGEQPGRVPFDARHSGPEHDPGDGRGEFCLPLVEVYAAHLRSARLNGQLALAVVRGSIGRQPSRVTANFMHRPH